MQEDNNIISYFIFGSASNAILFGILGFLLRNWFLNRLKTSIQHEYDVKLETLKSDLELKLSKEIEEIKNKNQLEQIQIKQELELANLAYQIKNSGIYQRRADAILEIHSILIKIYQTMIKYTDIFQNGELSSKQQLRKNVGETLDEFWNSFNKVRILFPEELDKQITTFIHTSIDKGIEFMIKVEKSEPESKDIDDWERLDDEMHRLWETILKSIREEFRILLGVNQD